MSMEDKLRQKIQGMRKNIEDSKQAKSAEGSEDKKSLFSMNKLKRLPLTADKVFYCSPLVDYDLGQDLFIHSFWLQLDNNKRKLTHILCSDLFKDNSCEHCAASDKAERSGDVSTQYKFAGRPVYATIMYVFNTVGEKWEFKDDKTGEMRTYIPNPTQVVEIEAGDTPSGNPTKGQKEVLNMMKTFAKNKMFKGVIWGICRKEGTKFTDSNGKERTRDAGFIQPEILNEEELIEKLGSQGFSANLPEPVAKWSENIAEMRKQNILGLGLEEGIKVTKQEVFKHVLTSFDNAEDIASLLGIELPKRKETNSVSR